MKRVIAALLLFASPAFAQSPCDGRIKDMLNHPKGAIGQIVEPLAGQNYVDPVFGVRITRISQPSPSEGQNAIIETLYNGLRGWNADSSQIIAWHRAGARTYEFYQGDAPYAHLGQIVFGGTATLQTSPADIEHIVWDSDDPNVLYYPAYDSLSTRKHPMLMKVVLHPSYDAAGKVVAWASAPTVTIQRDFLAECTAHGVATLQTLSIGHSMDMSYDGDRKLGLRCGGGGAGVTMWNFLYSIKRNVIIGDGTGYISQPIKGSAGYDYPPWVCPSGNCSWRQGPGIVYDGNFQQLGFTTMANTLEHTTVGYTLGDSTHPAFDFVAQSAWDEIPSSGNLLIWKLNQPYPIKPTVIIGEGTGTPPLPYVHAQGSHPSLAAKDGSGWIAVGNLGTTGTGNDGVLTNEIMLANVNTGEVCRVAHSRSCGGNCAVSPFPYWGETHPQISNDGYRILFNSDWEGGNGTPGPTVSLFVADLRPTATAILTPSLPNAVVGEPYNAPLSIAGGAGPPYDMTIIGAAPTGLGLVQGPNGVWSVSGTSTQVESRTFMLRACDQAATPQCDTHTYPLVSQERPRFTSLCPLPDAIVGSPYSFTFTTAGGVDPRKTSLLSGPICAGLQVNPDSTVTGNPTTLQTCKFTLGVTDSATQPLLGQQPCSMTVKLPPASYICTCTPPGLKIDVKP